MNTSTRHRFYICPALTAAAIASLLLAGCATAPMSPQGSADVRTKLTRLQSDPKLADRAPVALKEAELAVRAAEEPLANDPDDAALGAHRVYIADRKVDIAIAEASTRYAEDQRAKLGEERDRARLEARTREADMARSDADAARSDAEELQRQLDALHAEATDRGLVLTLGDVLFTSGRADLKVGTESNLNRLVVFLNKYPDRNIMIVGHTDSQGSDEYNLDLSQRRADSVQAYLMQQGISAKRIAASAMGEEQPVASNDTEIGRMQNRRVEVIIDQPPPATASATM